MSAMDHLAVPEPPLPRFLSAGRAFVYVIPCRDDTLFKIGYSRDPMERLRTLHRRFFAFFDLGRALLVEADRVREARAVEHALIQAMSPFTALAPPIVTDDAAGHTEWFRGALDQARAAAIEAARERALRIHDPASLWFRGRLADTKDRVHGWARRMLEAIEYERFNPGPDANAAARLEDALGDTLDAYESVALEVELPCEVERWRRARPAS